MIANRIAPLIAAGVLLALSPTLSPALTVQPPPPTVTPVADLAGNWLGSWSGNGITADFTMAITDTSATTFSGAFDWSCTSGISCSGYEYFSGSWSATNPSSFTFSSEPGSGSIDPAAKNIGPSNYTGSVVSLDTTIAGTDSNGGSWTATQVPEPATLGLLGLGLAGLGLARRKRAN